MTAVYDSKTRSNSERRGRQELLRRGLVRLPDGTRRNDAFQLVTKQAENIAEDLQCVRDEKRRTGNFRGVVGKLNRTANRQVGTANRADDFNDRARLPQQWFSCKLVHRYDRAASNVEWTAGIHDLEFILGHCPLHNAMFSDAISSISLSWRPSSRVIDA